MNEYSMLSKQTRQDIRFVQGPRAADPVVAQYGTLYYPGFQPGTTRLPAGFRKSEEYLALEVDAIFERDVACVLRDGTTVYLDIYRPDTTEPVPVIFNSTMFGKSGELNRAEHMNLRAHIEKAWVSGFHSFEALDPFYWCNAGYAVATCDVRGAFMSEGRTCYFGSQDAQDNYDMIEFLGTRPWSNGRVGMGGNSWLAITQWYVAALNPPHLAAIAPWEGHGNMYVDEYMRGGIPNYAYARAYVTNSENGTEDLRAMMRKYPLMNEYWEDKSAKFEKITCPAYVLASYSAPLHARGTFEGFRRISSPNKWLRVHNNCEWSDTYNPVNAADLRKFFDRYLKNEANGWEKTPRVRMSVLDNGHEDVVNRPEQTFPLERQQLKTFYLHADRTLGETRAPAESALCYDANPEQKILSPVASGAQLPGEGIVPPGYEGLLDFTMRFDRDVEITGYPKAHLWMEAAGHNDMDVYVRLSKLDAEGNTLYNYAYQYSYAGPLGMLRASKRAVDPERSTPCEPYHPYNSLSYLEPGEIVELEIGLWPTAMRFHKGEQLRMTISGYDFLGYHPIYMDSINENRGRHILHTGGQYDSYLLLPFIEP